MPGSGVSIERGVHVKHRSGIARALLITLALAVPAVPAGAPRAEADARPNLVLIVTDDQWIGSIFHMPRVKSLLADKGVSFTRAVATTPLCCPSRASLLTGQYASHHGVLDNVPPSGAQAFDDRSTLATWLD